MKFGQRHVCQECMEDWGGGMGSSKSESEKIMDTLEDSSESTQKVTINKILKKYYKIDVDALEALLLKHNPEKLV